MPITVFSLRGIPAIRRERIEAGVVAGGSGVLRSGAERDVRIVEAVTVALA